MGTEVRISNEADCDGGLVEEEDRFTSITKAVAQDLNVVDTSTATQVQEIQF